MNGAYKCFPLSLCGLPAFNATKRKLDPPLPYLISFSVKWGAQQVQSMVGQFWYVFGFIKISKEEKAKH
jgi:hypothetical protein